MPRMEAGCNQADQVESDCTRRIHGVVAGQAVLILATVIVVIRIMDLTNTKWHTTDRLAPSCLVCLPACVHKSSSVTY